MNSHFQMVGDFHLKFDLPTCNGGPESTEITPDLFLFRMDLIIEEAAEILRAYRKKDLPGFADGIGDLLYVCYGFLHYLDKPPTIRSTVFDQLVFTKAVIPKPYEFMSSLTMIHTYIADAMDDYRLYGVNMNVVSSIQNLVSECYTLARHGMIPIDLVFREIQRANMSKERSTGDSDGRSTRGSKFDVVKPANFVPPRIAEVLSGSI